MRDEISVLGFLHEGTKQHQQSRHNDKHRQQCKQHSLDQTNCHIRADLKLHKHHGNHTTDGSQAAGGDLRNTLAQSSDHRFPQG